MSQPKSFLKVFLFSLLIAAMLLSACGGAATPAPEQKPAEPQAPAAESEPAEIHVVFQTGGDMIPATQFLPQFEKENNAKVSTEEIPGENLYEKLVTEFTTQSGAYDLVEFYPTWLGGFAEAGFVQDLTPFFEKYKDQINADDYLQGVQNGATVWKDKRYGIPFDGDVLIFYYRKDLFGDATNQADFKAKYGYDLVPPETWEQVMDMAEFFDGRQEGLSGYETVASRLWWAVGYWSSIYYSLGGKYIDENSGEIVLDCEKFNQANEIQLKLLEHSPDGVLNFGYTEAKEALASGKVAMGLQWATSVFMDPRQSPMHDKLGFVVMPGTEQADGSVLHTPPLAVGKVLAIPASATNPDMAFKFAMLLSSTEGQVWSTVNGTGIDPNRSSAFKDESVVKVWGDILPVYEESLKIGVPDIRVPDSAKYYDVITGELHTVWSGQKSSADACSAVTTEWNRIAGK